MLAQCQAADGEFTAVIGIDRERRLHLSEALAPGAEDHLESIFARCDVELILVVQRMLFELLHLLLVLEHQFHGVAESSGHRTIRPVCDAKHIDHAAQFSLFLVELHRLGRDLHRDVHTRDVSRGVEKGRLHGSLCVPGLGGCGAGLQLLFDGVPGEQVTRLGIAVARASPGHGSATVLHFHAKLVAGAFFGFRRRVAE